MSALRPSSLVTSVACAMLACAHPLAAQAVSGRVSDAAGGASAAGVLVVLLDAAGAQKAGALTDAQGRFSVAAPAAGRWRVRAERVGRATAFAGPFDLAAGEVREVALSLHPLAVALDALVVEGRGQCRPHPEDGERTQALWEEARKALNSTAWSQSRDALRMEASTYRRELDPATLSVRDEQRQARTVRARQLFAALPAESLAANGYVRTARDGTSTYYAPDAAVLLSGSFLDGHCMRVRAGQAEQAGLVGLAFEPMRRGRLPDVEGVLWLDPASAELRYLEYHYVRLDLGVPTQGVGGRVEFDRLPTGEWLVRRWWVRTPVVEALRTGVGLPTRRLRAIRETGGEVVSVAAADGTPLSARPAGVALSGLVFDSARGAPLAGAQVFVSGTQYAATADGEGRFRVEGVPPGEYSVSFTHPRLDSAGAVPAARTVAVAGTDVEGLALAVPAPRAADPVRIAARPSPVAGSVSAATESAPLPVPGVEASARRGSAAVREFYSRAGRGAGRFVTRADIERLHATTTLQLFRGMPSVEVVGNSVRVRGIESPVPIGAPARAMTMDANANEGSAASGTGSRERHDGPGGDRDRPSDCVPALYLDGVRSDPSSADLSAIRPDDVEGIEVYPRSALAPAQFRRLDQDCAIILVWLRERRY
jgi:PAS domain-containing protein